MADTLLLGRQIPCHSGPPLSATAADQYFQWLARANSIQLLAVKGATMQKKISAFDKFCEFMSDTGRHALQGTPQDIKVYMTLWATTCGRYKHQGLDLAAPVSMRCLLSFLATEFDRYATTHGNWDPLRGQGNPVRSLDVAEWATGYTRWLAHLGYNPQSAHPWCLSDLQQVMARLDTRINTTTGVPLLRLHRDAFTMTILWETCSRGATAVSWCLDDLWLASGTPAGPCLYPSLQIPLGGVVLFKALEIKHNLHPEVMIITRKDGPLCPIQRLHALLVQSAALGHPVTQFLCRPLSSNKDHFIERSLSVAAFEEDIDFHFTAANIPYHATLHGSRRGSLQHHDQQGQTLEALGRLAQIKTPNVTKRYIDPTRHLPPKLPKGKRPNKKVRLT
eukprot:jgi/Botrbrau1/14421/Bobra.0014s0068.1